MPETKAVGQMNHAELTQHIKDKDEKHRKEMTHLRALLRCLEPEKK